MALSILDPENAYRYIQIRGRVGRVTEQGADAHINSLAKKYLGKDKYPFASARPDQGHLRNRADTVQAQG